MTFSFVLLTLISHSILISGVALQDYGICAPLQEAGPSGKSYYVAKNGNDSSPGTKAQPWLTVQKAAKTLAAGDVVYIRAGTYNERIIPKNSGTSGNYIIYTAYPGDTVTIDGSSITLPHWGGLFDVSNKHYIRVLRLRIINAGPNDNNAGILVDNSSHIIIRKNYTYNTVSSGIGVWNSNNITIDGNEVELACNDGEQECITVAETDTFEIKNNHIHHGGPGTHGGEGIDAKDGSTNGRIYGNHVHHMNRLGIYVDSWNKHTYNIEVFKNTVHDIIEADGFEVASESGGLLENIKIYNNLAYNNDNCGITISRNGESKKHPMRNIKIVNNTFYNNGKGSWGGGIFIDNRDVENIVIKNNICTQNLSFQIASEADFPAQELLVDHNLIQGYRGYEGEIYGTNYVKGNPKLVNPAGSDFHLRKDSPAIDSGSSVDAPSVDFDGNRRPQGAGYDIGAYEYAGSPYVVIYVDSGGTCNGNIPCYSKIQDAVNAAGRRTIIKVTGKSYHEDVVISKSKEITIQGGWNSSFTNQTSITTLDSMTISSAEVTVEYLNMR